ncbi:hypothetical protein FHG87_022976 [Trinorchestia longiramus]|nr:hypothetical protein FHG87_022976 [Trinorchestia longiramus]
MLCLSCSASHALPLMLCLSCSASHALPLMLCLSCSASHALPLMLCLSCSASHDAIRDDLLSLWVMLADIFQTFHYYSPGPVHQRPLVSRRREVQLTSQFSCSLRALNFFLRVILEQRSQMETRPKRFFSLNSCATKTIVAICEPKLDQPQPKQQLEPQQQFLHQSQPHQQPQQQFLHQSQPHQQPQQQFLHQSQPHQQPQQQFLHQSQPHQQPQQQFLHQSQPQQQPQQQFLHQSQPQQQPQQRPRILDGNVACGDNAAEQHVLFCLIRCNIAFKVSPHAKKRSSYK